MSIVYTDDRNVDYSQAAQVLARSIPVREGWDAGKTETAFRNSTYAVFALDGSRIAGTGRALSDGKAWTLITDVAVLPEYRGQGIGSGLLERIKERFAGHELFTYTYGAGIPFFEAHGFSRSRNSFTYAGKDDGAIDERLLDDGFFLPVGYRFEREFEPPAGSFPVGRKSSLDRDSVCLRFTETLEGVDFARLNTVLSQAFGGKERDAGITRETFEDSPFVSFAFDGDKLVGCAKEGGGTDNITVTVIY